MRKLEKLQESQRALESEAEARRRTKEEAEALGQEAKEKHRSAWNGRGGKEADVLVGFCCDSAVVLLLVVLQSCRLPRGKSRNPKLFVEPDSDHSGVISAPEVQALPKLDGDADGTVTETEARKTGGGAFNGFWATPPFPWYQTQRPAVGDLSPPRDVCVTVTTRRQRRVTMCVLCKMERKMEENVRDPDTGSEAGGEDSLVGNVSKLQVTPPGYTGLPRKGHLVFDACFESGNLGRVDYISEFEFDLFIRPDTCNPRFRVWFNFSVENVRESQGYFLTD
ncbi:Cytosolic carboxypeptidase 6 [Acipenser ruthenus]|uniref:Cytosolic carboxypeptidase 6 n=1 Tax=Acipenser ruthenus TaxID=7906 RepID=A0A662YWP0_ACIRT|nr:Cytosolic carboxypeptidase 6 [Acipenser ruthenus]